MELILFPNIYYELVTESCEGKTFCQSFTHVSVLESREAALNCFLDSILSDELRPDEIFVTLYVRYLVTGERIELLSTASYEHPEENLKALERELFLFQQENIATNVAIYNHERPNQITILWPRFRNAHMLITPSVSVMIASHYWVFLKKKKELYRVA